MVILVAAAVLVDFTLRKVLDIPRGKFWGKYEYESLILGRWDKYVTIAFLLLASGIVEQKELYLRQSSFYII
ncbi:hypothetical protein ACLHDF_16410 [Priestia aryabhattai]|uniref:hypothetical protein n=1 Tax=Priestia megaterium TaxID=1404 RepID=UPI0039B9906C